MTVRRTTAEQYPASKEEVFLALRVVLAGSQDGYRYVETSFFESAGGVSCRVRPKLWPLMMSTALTVQVDEDADGSLVTVETCSQFFIIADVFNFYNKYITDLLFSLGEELIAAHEGTSDA